MIRIQDYTGIVRERPKYGVMRTKAVKGMKPGYVLGMTIRKKEKID